MTIGNFSGLYPNYPMYTNTVYPSTNPIGKDEANPNAVDPSADPGKRSSPEDCETCANRKYQDGSDENVSFKTASHISPESAGARVRAHEGEHVSNAYKKAAQKDGKVLNASVSIHTSICPECGRTYVAGGVTNTTIKYSNEDTPYTKNQRQLDATKFRGANIDYAA